MFASSSQSSDQQTELSSIELFRTISKAISEGDLHSFNRLVCHLNTNNVNQIDKKENTLLHIAVLAANDIADKILKEKDVDINKKKMERIKETIKLLLKCGRTMVGKNNIYNKSSLELLSDKRSFKKELLEVIEEQKSFKRFNKLNYDALKIKEKKV